MEKIKGTIDSWQGGNFDNSITLNIEESDSVNLMELVGRKVIITLQDEESTEPTLPEKTKDALNVKETTE